MRRYGTLDIYLRYHSLYLHKMCMCIMAYNMCIVHPYIDLYIIHSWDMLKYMVFGSTLDVCLLRFAWKNNQSNAFLMYRCAYLHTYFLSFRFSLYGVLFRYTFWLCTTKQLKIEKETYSFRFVIILIKYI